MLIHTEEATAISGTSLCQLVLTQGALVLRRLFRQCPSLGEMVWFIVSCDTGTGFLTHAALSTGLTKVFFLHSDFTMFVSLF